MAYINVDEVYILDNTGLQVDMATDIPFADAGFSDTQKAQARKNIAAGGTNPNLLDNPWFGSGEVINQRGATSGNTTVGPYFIDRWQTDYTGTGGASGTYSVGSTGITFAQTGTAFGGFRQSLGMPLTDGATYTVSVKYADGTIETATRQLSLSSNTYFINSDTVLIMRLSSSGVWRFLFGGTVTIRAIKLELGSVSTLANDAPPNYKNELDACQGYFQRIGKSRFVGTAVALNNGSLRLIVPIPTMAKTPTFATMLVPEVYDGSSWQAVTSYSVVDYDPSYIHFSLSTSITVTSGNTYLVRATHIDLSADL